MFAKIGKNFKVIPKAYDDEIEAIKHNNYNWLGWMWHPERNSNFFDLDQIRFKTLIDG